MAGAFRGVPPLATLPTLVAAALASHTGFALGPALIGGLVVAYSALATWLPRMDRAIGLTAGTYVVVTIAAIPAAMLLFGEGPGAASASPFWGVGYSCALFGGNGGPRHQVGEQAAWLVLWIVAYGSVALGLLLATLKTSNRCLGRINDPPREEPSPRPARKPAPPPPDASAAPSSRGRWMMIRRCFRPEVKSCRPDVLGGTGGIADGSTIRAPADGEFAAFVLLKDEGSR